MISLNWADGRFSWSLDAGNSGMSTKARCFGSRGPTGSVPLDFRGKSVGVWHPARVGTAVVNRTISRHQREMILEGTTFGFSLHLSAVSRG